MRLRQNAIDDMIKDMHTAKSKDLHSEQNIDNHENDKN